MKFILSVDDGCASDVRIAELCKKYGIECVFYWPVEWHSLAYSNGYEPLDWNDATYIIDVLGFELGSHTITHRHLTKLSDREIYQEVSNSRYMLENMFETPVLKFCPPRGYMNDYAYRVAKKTGYETVRLTKGKHLVHIHPNSGANNNKPWRECIDKNTEELWGHSHEWDKYDMWDEIEEFLSGKS